MVQEMQADLGSKSGRVSDATMLKLCRHVMGKREPQWKGFILEGWPKTPDQAEQLFTEDQPYTYAVMGFVSGICASHVAYGRLM